LDEDLSTNDGFNAPSQFLSGGVNHPRRDFFASDFEQKVRHQAISLWSQNYSKVNVSRITKGVSIRHERIPL